MKNSRNLARPRKFELIQLFTMRIYNELSTVE